MREILTALIAALSASALLAQANPSPAAPQSAPPTAPLAPLSFLVGAWQAEGGGQPGRSVGRFSFEWSADGQALLRRNESATAGGRHADVMLIYPTAGGALRAVYVDNEGHTIEYSVAVAPDRPRVVFESAGPGPRFRLWYETAKAGELKSGFEIAPPGATEFKTYLEGVARRE